MLVPPHQKRNIFLYGGDWTRQQRRFISGYYMENEFLIFKRTQNFHLMSVSERETSEMPEWKGGVQWRVCVLWRQARCGSSCKALERLIWTPLPVTDQMRTSEERAGRDVKYCLESNLVTDILGGPGSVGTFWAHSYILLEAAFYYLDRFCSSPSLLDLRFLLFMTPVPILLAGFILLWSFQWDSNFLSKINACPPSTLFPVSASL